MAGTMADEMGNEAERAFRELLRDLLRARTGHSTLLGAAMQRLTRKSVPESSAAIAVGGGDLRESHANAQRLGDWLDGRGVEWDLREDRESMTVSLIVPVREADAAEAYAEAIGIDAARLSPIAPLVAEGKGAEEGLRRLADYLRGSGVSVGSPEPVGDAFSIDVPRTALSSAMAFASRKDIVVREATDDEARTIGLGGGAASLFSRLDRDDDPLDWFRGGDAAEADEYLRILRQKGLWAERFDATVFYRVRDIQKVKDAFRDEAERASAQLADRVPALPAPVPTLADAARNEIPGTCTPGQAKLIRELAPAEAESFLGSNPSKAAASRFLSAHGADPIARFERGGARAFEDGMEAVRGKDLGGTFDTPQLTMQMPPAHDSDPSTPWADGSDAPGTGDSDRDGIMDSAEDADGDGVPDDEEWVPTARSQSSRLGDRCANAKACAGAAPDAVRPEIGHGPETR